MQRRSCTVLLVAALALAGCGRPAVLGSSVAPAGLASQSVSEHAKKFAGLVKPRFKGTVTVKGSVVTLTAPEQGPVSYDFKTAPQDGQVTVTAEGFSTKVSEQRLLETVAHGDKILPPMVVTIAIHVAIGGAKALAIYWLTHRDDFDKEEAIRATVIGMGTALVAFLPYGQYMKWLVPIAVDLIMSVKVGDLKEIMAAAMKQVDKIVEVIKRMLDAESKKAAPAL